MGNKLKTVDAETLLSTPMSKTMFIVDGLISQGVNVISGASKIGKSWLLLGLFLRGLQRIQLLFGRADGFLQRPLLLGEKLRIGSVQFEEAVYVLQLALGVFDCSINTL